MYRDIDEEITELQSELRKTYCDWKKRHNFLKYPEDFDHFIVFYGDGEYEPTLFDVICCLTGYIKE